MTSHPTATSNDNNATTADPPQGHQKGSEASTTPPSHLPMANSTRDVLPSISVEDTGADGDGRPPLPPRPGHVDGSYQTYAAPSSLRLPKSSRPRLQSSATTALSLTDIHTQSYQDGSRETFDAPSKPVSSGRFLKGFDSIRRLRGPAGSEADTASVRSIAPTFDAGGDAESLLGDVLGKPQQMPTWDLAGHQNETLGPFGSASYEKDDYLSSFDSEFDDLEALNTDEGGEGTMQP